MKLRYNRKVLPYSILLIFIFFVEDHFFGIFTVPDVIEFAVYKNRAKWIAVLAMVMAYVCWRNHRRIMQKYSRFLKRYFLSVVVAVTAHIIYASIKYPLNRLITTYGFGSYYLYCFLAVPILFIFETNGGIEWFMKRIRFIAIIVYSVSIIQGISYLRTGSLVFSAADVLITGGMVRNGKIRMGTGSFGNLMLIYSIYLLYNQKKDRKDRASGVAILILGILNVYLTGQTRMILLTVLCCIAILIWFGDGSLIKKLFSIATVMAVIFFVFASGIFNSFITSFSTGSDYAGSTIARLEAWKYYFVEFLHNPIFAIGFAGDENYYHVVHGNSSTLYETVRLVYDYSDCGVIGQLAILGCFLAPVYLWPVARFSKLSFYLMNRKELVPGTLLIAFSVYLLITSVTLCILDSGRVAAWPLLIAVFEYYRCHVSEKRQRL